MTQPKTLNVKWTNSQVNKSNSGTQNGNEVTWKLLSNVVSDKNNDKNNFSHKLLLTNTQVSKL